MTYGSNDPRRHKWTFFRALEDARALQESLWMRGAEVLGGAALAAASWVGLMQSSEHWSLRILGALFSGFVGGFAVWLVLLVYQWLRAPYKQRNEAYAMLVPVRDRVDAALDDLEDRKLACSGHLRYGLFLVEIRQRVALGISEADLLALVAEKCHRARDQETDAVARDLLVQWTIQGLVAAEARGTSMIHIFTDDGREAVRRFVGGWKPAHMLPGHTSAHA